MNDNIFKNAVVILLTFVLAAQMQWRSEMAVAFAGGIFILPFFLFSTIAGQIADRFNKNQITRWIKFAEILIMGMGAYGFYKNSAAMLLWVLFLMGAHSTFFGPIKYGILPDHLEKKELLFGNAFIEASTFIAILIGMVFGSLLILKPGGVAIISAVLLIVAAGGWVASFFIPIARGHEGVRIGLNIIRESYRLMRDVRQTPDLMKTILGISWFWFIGATWVAVVPSYVKDVLGGDENVVTLFFILFAVGIGVGSILCNFILKDELTSKYVPIAGLGLTVTTLSFVQISKVMDGGVQGLHDLLSFSGMGITCSLFGVGVFGGLFTVPLYSLLQYWSKPKHRARNVAVNNIINAFFMVVSTLFAMALYHFGSNILDVLFWVGMINILVALYMVTILPEAAVKAFLKYLLKILYNVKVNGLDNYNKAKPGSIVIANHTSLLDGVLLRAYLPGGMIFVVDATIAQKWWVKIFIFFEEFYTVDPRKPIVVRELVDLVKRGKRLVIFPEGRITLTGAIMKVYEGPGFVADKAEAEIIPIRIEGAQYTPFSYLRKNIRTRWFPNITINVFPPYPFKADPTKVGKSRRQAVASKLYDKMVEMALKTSKVDQTLFDGLLDSSSIHKMSTIILDDMEGKPINYRKLITNSIVLGEMLVKGIENVDEPIGLMIPNSKAAVVAFFALQSKGQIAAMLNYSWGYQDIINACKTAKIKHIWTTKQLVEKGRLKVVIHGIKGAGVHVHYLEDLVAKKKHYVGKMLLALIAPRWVYRKQQRRVERAALGKSTADRPCVILFTSGFTGTPKGVVLSHKNINTNINQMASMMDYVNNDKVFNVLPLFHAYGLTVGTLMPLFCGVGVWMYPSPLHFGIIPELVYRQDATVLLGTNTFLKAYLRRANPYDFYALRYVFSGAERVQESTRKAYYGVFGLRIFEGYGTTETSPVLAANTPMHNKIGTVGKMLPGIEYRLQEVPGISHGKELWVRGGNVMLGYMVLEQPGVIQSLEDGWLNTGDVVTIDKFGFIKIVDRTKRFAKIGAEMLSLLAIEEMFEKVWPDRVHACISVPNAKHGEELVIITEKPEADLQQVRNYARAKGISPLMVPKRIFYKRKIPLLGTGKPDYMALREEFRES